jgi:Rrf2 family iron-sulfur cluster assembly transcriptional regulator
MNHGKQAKMRLEITRKSDLAIRALLSLARLGDKTKAGVLAQAVGTTTGFLSQVMTPLIARGWVRSDPGPTGGYTCVCDVNQLSILDVIEVIEGPTDTVHCVLVDRQCSEAAPCAMHGPWSRARFILLRELGSTALGSIALPAGPRIV